MGEKKKGKNVIEEEEEEEEDAGDESDIGKMTAGYNYLLSMPLWNLTLEKVEKMRKQKEEKEFELEELCNTSPERLWEMDLDNFLEGLNKFEEDKAKLVKDEEAAARRAVRKKKKKKKTKTKILFPVVVERNQKPKGNLENLKKWLNLSKLKKLKISKLKLTWPV